MSQEEAAGGVGMIFGAEGRSGKGCDGTLNVDVPTSVASGVLFPWRGQSLCEFVNLVLDGGR